MQGSGFYFCEISVNDICREIKRFKVRNTEQSTDVPINVLRENPDIFSA